MPTEKSPGIESLLTQIAGISRQEAARTMVCACCKKPLGKFRDELSQREWAISGMCQKCQDEVFGGE